LSYKFQGHLCPTGGRRDFDNLRKHLVGVGLAFEIKVALGIQLEVQEDSFVASRAVCGASATVPSPSLAHGTSKLNKELIFILVACAIGLGVRLDSCRLQCSPRLLRAPGPKAPRRPAPVDYNTPPW
jgi:hypothetical protein